MEGYRQEKVQKFEEFVDRRLKPDLVRAISERDKVFEQQKIFSDLRRNIENLEENSVTSLRTLVNLGSEVYMQADVQVEEYTRLIASIKAQIKLVCEGIRELLQLPAEKSLPERIF
ncbi:hypothetical protein Tsubulata_033441 [Turnera subulata]|uniref:Uncharacterized protein n=1 Tax=Turnera subulata TaxID=218843 RepID=A0A9Q0GI16_9ROSI|nr:hypothetical protein Tsubulata_033441 [Turnera subulata]